jgi:hypothetical protein
MRGFRQLEVKVARSNEIKIKKKTNREVQKGAPSYLRLSSEHANLKKWTHTLGWHLPPHKFSIHSLGRLKAHATSFS